ncbi:thioredoxin TrxC [Gilvimarinus japonicus]|uniref:Thioredoxin n=1 Tax=Gilvimarinus japonicus TaxID=1796469 RepID=A0ABV7HMH4_9GAMM
MAIIQTLCSHCLTANRVDETRLNDSPKCGKCRNSVFAAQPIAADDAQFSRWLHNEQLPLVVDFWAEWCGPCKTFAPAFARAASGLEPVARFIKINTELAQQTSAQFGIRSIPTLMVFHDGQAIAQQAGALPYPQFLQWLNGALNP